MRIDDPNVPNPFSVVPDESFRYFEMDPSMSVRLLLAEAQEFANGWRHLTVVHGDPREVVASRQLSEFYEELRRLAAGCEWVRVRGNAEYVTVTVRGAVADERIALFEAAAAFADPGHWTIVASAVPPLS